jgi:hypothetical protein
MIRAAHPNIQYTTYGSFSKRVRSVAFPEGMSVQLSGAVDNYICVALIKAQKFIDLFRSIQVSFYFSDQIDVHCGVGRLVAPRGKINAVYAFTCDAQCRKVFYDHATPHRIDCWRAANECKWTPKELTSGEAFCYPYGVGPTEEEDMCFLRGERFFAMDRSYRMYLAPRFPCQYILAVHWEGLRRTWSPLDAIPDDDDLIDWAAAEVQAEVALRHEMDAQRYNSLVLESNEKLADLAWWSGEERRVQARHQCVNGLEMGNLADMFLPLLPPHVVIPDLTDVYLTDPDGVFIEDPQTGDPLLVPA